MYLIESRCKHKPRTVRIKRTTHLKLELAKHLFIDYLMCNLKIACPFQDKSYTMPLQKLWFITLD